MSSVVESEHQRLTRQLNYATYLRGICEGSNSRLRKAIDGSLWLISSLRESGRSYEQIVLQVERRLLEAMALDAKIIQQEGLVQRPPEENKLPVE